MELEIITLSPIAEIAVLIMGTFQGYLDIGTVHGKKMIPPAYRGRKLCGKGREKPPTIPSPQQYR
ncbi:MAG: hypothetical protein HDQ99_01160 [Lachnospiraceae bacterium]|nr:hypothetical protein [Lachnospiraceae bacterium]